MMSRVSPGMVVVLLLALVFAVVAQAQAQPKIPPDFSFEKSKDSPGQVAFSHEKHMKTAEKCTACHTKVFKMKKGATGAFSMAKMNAGESCGTCHNGKTEMGGKAVFTTNDKGNCEKCHKK